MTETEKELKTLVESIYLKLKEGITPEIHKLELKGKWIPLNNCPPEELKINISKFLKELVGLGNTYGPKGYLIYGINETGDLTNSPYRECGLKDRADLYNLVVKNVDKPLRFESYDIQTDIDGNSKIISVIVIPPSIDKPHVIREYKTERQHISNYIPVRKETAVYPATRSDIDLMYYDKQNIVPEYALDLVTSQPLIHVLCDSGIYTKISLPVIFENYGRKPIILCECKLTIIQDELTDYPNELEFVLWDYRVDNGTHNNSIFRQAPIIISSNNAISYICSFRKIEGSLHQHLGSCNFKYFLTGADVSGNLYLSELYERKGMGNRNF